MVKKSRGSAEVYQVVKRFDAATMSVVEVFVPTGSVEVAEELADYTEFVSSVESEASEDATEGSEKSVKRAPKKRRLGKKKSS